jgi:phosphoglycolate phosphatase
MMRGVIWDLDGTLVDSLPAISLSLNHALAQLGHPQHAVEAVRSFIGNGASDLARRAVPPGVVDPEKVAADIEAAFKADYATRWVEGTEPYPGVIDLLKKIHAAGVRQAVLSNKPHPFTTEIVARIFPPGVFDAVMGQSAEFPKKPEPDAALHLIEQWGLVPEDCLFIGDSSVDAETAARAGMPFLLVAWGYQKEEEKPRLASCEQVPDVPALGRRLLGE